MVRNEVSRDGTPAYDHIALPRNYVHSLSSHLE